MAQVTNWLKRLGRPSRRRRVSVMALEDFWTLANFVNGPN
jgi:hypothetical protein